MKVEEGSTGPVRAPRFTISSRLLIAALGAATCLGGCSGRTQAVHQPPVEAPAPPVKAKPAEVAVDPVRTAEEALESTPALPDVAPAKLPTEPLRHEFSIPFASGSAELGPRARTMLDDLSRWIEGAGGFCELEIRTAPRGGGSSETRLDLARRRGESVRAYLLQQAPIRPERIRVLADGEVPLAKTAPPTRRAQPVIVAVLPH